MIFHLKWWVSILNVEFLPYMMLCPHPRTHPLLLLLWLFYVPHLLSGILWNLVQFSNVLLMKLKIPKLIFLKFIWEPAVWASVFVFSSLKSGKLCNIHPASLLVWESLEAIWILLISGWAQFCHFWFSFFPHFFYTYNCTPTYYWRSYLLAILVKPFLLGI